MAGPVETIQSPVNTTKRIVEAVGEHQQGDTIMIEVGTDERMEEIYQKVCEEYPHSKFMMESFKVCKTLWAYIHIKQI